MLYCYDELLDMSQCVFNVAASWDESLAVVLKLFCDTNSLILASVRR